MSTVLEQGQPTSVTTKATEHPLSHKAAQTGRLPQNGDLVLNFYTPGPVTALGGTGDAMSVAHDGWEGWGPNAKFQLPVRLTGVTVDDLEPGRRYPVVVGGISGAGFLPVYSTYDGRFYDYFPYQEAFTGHSRSLAATGLSGRVEVIEAGAGVLRGRLILRGAGERIEIEHTMRDGSRDQPVFER